MKNMEHEKGEKLQTKCKSPSCFIEQKSSTCLSPTSTTNTAYSSSTSSSTLGATYVLLWTGSWLPVVAWTCVDVAVVVALAGGGCPVVALKVAPASAEPTAAPLLPDLDLGDFFFFFCLEVCSSIRIGLLV